MKAKTIFLVIFASVLISSGIQGVQGSVNDTNEKEIGNISMSDSTTFIDAPIIIRGDEEAAIAASSGNGTPEDPFVIENKHIICNETISDYIWISLLGIRKYWFLAGISIHDVSASLLLRNIIVETLSGDKRSVAFMIDNCDAIDLENVQTIGSFEFGIYIRGDFTDPTSPIINGDFSVNNFEVNGFLSEGDGGVVLSFLNIVSIFGGFIDNLYDFGLRKGMTVSSVLNFYMRNVNFHNCPLFIDIPIMVNCDIDQSNTVNGKPILFLNQQSGFSIDSDDLAQIIAIGCSNFEISNMVMDVGGYFITLYNCIDGWIHDIEMTNSRYDALYTVYCGGIIVENCLIHYNIRAGILNGAGDPLRKNIIRNNVIFDNGRNVRPILTTNMEISGNEIYFTEEVIDLVFSTQEWANLYGIQMMGADNIEIKENHIYNVNHAIENEYFYGIGTSVNITVDGNAIDAGYVQEVSSYPCVGIETLIPASNWNIIGNILDNFDEPIKLEASNSKIDENEINGGAFNFLGENLEMKENAFFNSTIFVSGNNAEISFNNIIECPLFYVFGDGVGVSIFLNGFFDSTVFSIGTVSWNCGVFGNYWSDYSIKYPNAKRGPHFTWRTPYQISDGIFDSKPLVQFPLPMNEHAIYALIRNTN